MVVDGEVDELVHAVDSLDGRHEMIDELRHVVQLHWTFIGKDAAISDLEDHLGILDQVEVLSAFAVRIEAVDREKQDLKEASWLAQSLDLVFGTIRF